MTSWEEPRYSYGSTETFTLSTCFPPGTPHSITGDTHGVPLPGNTLKIVDPVSGETLARGEHGEIAVKGPTLMLGYLGVPVEEAFDEEGFFRTGDGGYVDEHGRLHFQGRLTTVIKTGGANVSPLEIDAVLESFPGVKAARAVGVPHETLGEMVVACVVPIEGATLDGAAIQNFARERLASYKVPRRVLFLRERRSVADRKRQDQAGRAQKAGDRSAASGISVTRDGLTNRIQPMAIFNFEWIPPLAAAMRRHVLTFVPSSPCVARHRARRTSRAVTCRAGTFE